MNQKSIGLFSIPVFVAALGYFVDIYDLLLFSIIRVDSLKDLGYTTEQITSNGENIISWQMAGLLIGGILWGMLGDKKGRLSVLFGSIIIYSLANIANGFVHDATQYEIVRFIAGIGLAGELGAGITLVSELIAKEKRGVATSMVAGIGLTGAVLAFVMKQNFDWRTCYFIGGGLGFLLLIMRISVFESGMFQKMKESKIAKGDFTMLFSNGERFKRYLKGILIGLPTWFVIGVLVSFSDKFAIQFGITEKIDPGKSILYAYVAISLGDIIIGLISQQMRSRKKALFLFYGITALFITLYFTILYNSTASMMYWICAGMGFGTGFWAIFVTMGAEQFGTNLRATAATTIPNMVRGMLAFFIIPMFKFFRGFDSIGYVNGAIITGVIIMLITVIAAYYSKETFGKDLNYVEE
jgi:MFS transporter, putative metabolite:H+ symporter